MNIQRYSQLMRDAFGGDEPEAQPLVLDDDAGRVARGDASLSSGYLPSPLVGVSDDQWTQFVRVMMTAKMSDVSPANALGAFELSPRRLEDLGLVTRVKRGRSRAGRTIWTAVFVPPMTAQAFLLDPREQYKTFLRSMTDYADSIAAGAIQKPREMSLSGALAILHRGGPKGLDAWQRAPLPDTQNLYDRAAGIF